MIDASTPALRRRFYLKRALQRRSVGCGSDLEYLMALPRTTLPVDIGTALRGESWCAVGAIATRAYMPERSTKDIDILVLHERYDAIRQAFIADGWKEGSRLHFPGSSLGLSGSTFMKEGVEVDVMTSEQTWATKALASPHYDQTGLRVIPLAYLVLMKLDAARAIDQGDLSRMLGRVDENELEAITSVVKEYLREAEIDNEIRQYAELGRLERSQEKERDQGNER
jgi:hypothetical protein